MKTRSIKQKETTKKWYLIDAKDIRLGKLATKVASILIGKHRVNRVDYLDNGDIVIVINAEKVSVFRKKLEKKMYYRHSGYMGSLTAENLKSLLAKKPEEVIRFAVKGMLPNTKLRDSMLKRLFIYRDEKHPHEAQKPEILEVK